MQHKTETLMTSHDRFARFLCDERSRKLDTLEFFEAGLTGVHERQGADRVDVTLVEMATLRKHIRQIEDILGEAGEEFDA